MKNRYRNFYMASLAFILLVSAYPLYMGVKTLALSIVNGAVDAAEYPKYIIPYTPICIALILVTALFGLIYKRFGRYSLLAGSVLGTVTFLAAELGFEQINVIEGYESLPIDSWQYSLCIATPEVLQAIGEPIYADGNPAYKVHFYLISLIIVLTVTGLIHGYTVLFRENDVARRRPLLLQTACVAVFVGLCVLACFTAFYREGDINISPLSAALMTAFFVVFGVTAGAYLGGLLYGRSRLVGVVLPCVSASVMTAAMYAAELVLMDGQLFSFGKGWLFSPVLGAPLSLFDYLVIIASGALTWLLLRCVAVRGKTEIRAA